MPSQSLIGEQTTERVLFNMESSELLLFLKFIYLGSWLMMLTVYDQPCTTEERNKTCFYLKHLNSSIC